MKKNCKDASIYSHRPVSKQSANSVFWGYFWKHRRIVNWKYNTSICASCGATIKIPNRFYTDVPYKLLCNGLFCSTLLLFSVNLMAVYISFPLALVTSLVIYFLLLNFGKNAIIAYHLAFGKWEETYVPIYAAEAAKYEYLQEISANKQRIAICEAVGQYFPFILALIIKHIL